LAEEGCFASDSEEASDDDSKNKQKFRLVPPASLFSGNFPDGRRSNLFGNAYGTDHRHTEKAYGDGLYVGLIRNFHGGDMDGCANPEMEEICWTEMHRVQLAGNNSTFTLPMPSAKKRPAAACSTIEKFFKKRR